jgi:hypothetical protein
MPKYPLNPAHEAAAKAHFGCTLYRASGPEEVDRLWATGTRAVKDHSYHIAEVMLKAAYEAELDDLL